MTANKAISKMAISFYHHANREGENFVKHHTISYQLSGSLTLFDGKNEYVSQKGLLRLVRGNRLMKFIKNPERKTPFRSLSIYLEKNFLKEFAREYPHKFKIHHTSDPVMNLKKDHLLKNYLQTVQVYVLQNVLEEGNPF